ncbi:putative transporter SEO1 [Colletotrichum orbiculare MAFF 240422]|uniref:Transporter SEO1 n=1 Tax=Colletotrichum orbiculare (strain 104-T / ATCC 96160 / CBS 514.97 / LARS 414 / MAFF 240422) TaxID=1213857 RepID=N4VFQ3_COLOR|nr:putative transporter SEO1 [Colletotrichum orbiculare MAFF 240422]
MKFGSLAFAARHERTPEESRLVRRLDIFLMTFGCVSQVIKYLDQTNISNAYVSGMKEDLNLQGNEYNYFTTYFNVAYCIMLIPSQVILTYVRPSYWLSGLEVCWGVITAMFALVKNAQQVYALRVLLGLCESSAWPGMMTLLMYWYTPSELAKRMGFYHSCQAVGSMMSGALQVAIRSSMHGLHGLPGWRWLFIINAIMTVVVGALGFVMLPDTPNNPNPRAFWFKKEDAKLAMERLERHGKAEPKKMTWAAARRAFGSWVIYFLPVLYIATVLETYGNNYFNLFLKSLKNADGSPRWTTSEVNAIPIGGSAINVVFVWVWAILSDLLMTRWTLIVIQAVIGLVVCIMMSVWTAHPTTTSIGTAYASFFVTFTAMGTAPLIFAWLADLLPQDPEARTLIVGVSIAGYYAISAWSQVLVWPASQAPYYKYAWQSSIAIGVLVIIMTCVLRWIDVKYLLPKREEYRNTVIEAAADDVERAGSISSDPGDKKVRSATIVPEV